MPRGETSNVADGLENVVAAETVLSKVDGDAGVLILRGHYLQEIAGRAQLRVADRPAVAGLRGTSAWTRRRCAATSAWRASTHSSACATCCRWPGACRRWQRCRMLLASVPDDADDAPLLLTATVAVGLAAVIRIRDGQHACPAERGHRSYSRFPADAEGCAADTRGDSRAGDLPALLGRSWAERIDVHRARRGVHAGQPDRRRHRRAVRPEGSAAWRRAGSGARHARRDRPGRRMPRTGSTRR